MHRRAALPRAETAPRMFGTETFRWGNGSGSPVVRKSVPKRIHNRKPRQSRVYFLDFVWVFLLLCSFFRQAFLENDFWALQRHPRTAGKGVSASDFAAKWPESRRRRYFVYLNIQIFRYLDIQIFRDSSLQSFLKGLRFGLGEVPRKNRCASTGAVRFRPAKSAGSSVQIA